MSPAELITEWEKFKAENPGADPVMFEAYLDHQAAAIVEEPIPVSEDDVRQMLRTVGS